MKPLMSKVLHITVAVDAELAGDLHRDLLVKLARGITARSCYGGVVIDGLPGFGRTPPIFASSDEAIAAVLRVAEVQVAFAENVGLTSTATGRYMLDRATFLRLACDDIAEHRTRLWPGETSVESTPARRRSNGRKSKAVAA